MEIREVNEKDDLRKISAVYAGSWKRAYRGIVPDAYLDQIDEGQWSRHICMPGRRSVILLDGDEIVGTSSYMRSRDGTLPDYGEVVSVYLLPEYWGKGYGSSLLQASVNGLFRMGFSDLFLWVLEENYAARKFYGKNGFSASPDRKEIEIGGKWLREVRYVFHKYPNL